MPLDTAAVHRLSLRSSMIPSALCCHARRAIGISARTFAATAASAANGSAPQGPSIRAARHSCRASPLAPQLDDTQRAVICHARRAIGISTRTFAAKPIVVLTTISSHLSIVEADRAASTARAAPATPSRPSRRGATCYFQDNSPELSPSSGAFSMGITHIAFGLST